MSDQNSIYCPSCQSKTNLIVRATYQNGLVNYEIADCNGCSQYFLIIRNRNNGSIIKLYPSSLARPVDERIPEKIKSDLKSALACYAINEYRAAAAMARRSLQSICLDKGAPKSKKLKDQIDWLFEQGIITKDLVNWAHEVRYVGNDGAHPESTDDETPVTQNDAEDILALLEKITDVLYVATAIYNERKAAKEAVENNAT